MLRLGKVGYKPIEPGYKLHADAFDQVKLLIYWLCKFCRLEAAVNAGRGVVVVVSQYEFELLVVQTEKVFCR